MGGRHESHLGDESRVLQVAVCHSALEIVSGHQAALNVFGKRVSPQEGLSFGVKAHASHAHLRRIRGPKESGLLGHDFG